MPKFNKEKSGSLSWEEDPTLQILSFKKEGDSIFLNVMVKKDTLAEGIKAKINSETKFLEIEALEHSELKLRISLGERSKPIKISSEILNGKVQLK